MKTDRQIIVKRTAPALGLDQGEIFLDLQEPTACVEAVLAQVAATLPDQAGAVAQLQREWTATAAALDALRTRIQTHLIGRRGAYVCVFLAQEAMRAIPPAAPAVAAYPAIFLTVLDRLRAVQSIAPPPGISRPVWRDAQAVSVTIGVVLDQTPATLAALTPALRPCRALSVRPCQDGDTPQTARRRACLYVRLIRQLVEEGWLALLDAVGEAAHA